MMSLSRAGYKTFSAQRRESTPLQQQLHKQGVEFLWFAYNPDSDILRFANDTQLARNAIKAAKPDLICFTNGIPLASFSAIMAAREMNIPYVIWEGLVQPKHFPSPGHHWDQAKENYLNAEAVVCVSQQNLNIIQRHFQMPDGFGTLIPTFAASRFFEPANPQRRKQIRQAWAIPDDAIICITAAKFEPVKGYEIQLAALKKLKKTKLWERLYFVWAGDGPFKGAVEKRLGEIGAASHVRLLGHVWNLETYLDGADLMALTSHAEGLPLTVVEGMAKGLPVIATDVGGVKDALAGCGQVIAPPLNPARTRDEFIQALQTLAADKELRKQLGQAAQTRAVARYHESWVMDQVVELIDKGLDQQARKGRPPPLS